MPRTSRWRQQPRAPRLQQAVKTVLEADALDTAVARGLDDGADDRVQARRVAAAGEDSKTFDRHPWTIANGCIASWQAPTELSGTGRARLGTSGGGAPRGIN